MARLHGKHQVSTYRRGSKNPAHRTSERQQSPDGKVQCPVCLRLDVSLTGSGHLREHQAPDKMKCPNRTPPMAVLQDQVKAAVDQVIAVMDPIKHEWDPEQEVFVTSRVTDGTLHQSPTGRCQDCDRPVSGERRLCGSCLVKRGNV